MMKMRNILLVLVVSIAALLHPEVVCSAECYDVCTLSTAPLAASDAESETLPTEPSFTLATQPLLSTTTAQGWSYNLSPVARTLPRTLRMAEREHEFTKATRAIDSTMATTRYGLYNHKILFVAHPRLYYLCRMMRLII